MRSRDRLLLAGAAALAIVSAGFFGVLAERRIAAMRAQAAPAPLAGSGYVAVIAELSPRTMSMWPAPAAQTRGRNWIFDTFTPPEIYFQPRTKQFTVLPPAGLADEAAEAFGLELVGVRSEPFPLQLIGFAGEGSQARGIFENLRSGEVFLAAAGRRVPDLALSIESLDVRRRPVTLPRSMTTLQRVAMAVVHDEKAGRDFTLTHRQRQFTGTAWAVVAREGETATREVKAGDTFRLGSAVYHVDRVQLKPPSVEVTKQSPNLSQPDHRTLVPREAEMPDASDSSVRLTQQ